MEALYTVLEGVGPVGDDACGCDLFVGAASHQHLLRL